MSFTGDSIISQCQKFEQLTKIATKARRHHKDIPHLHMTQCLGLFNRYPRHLLLGVRVYTIQTVCSHILRGPGSLWASVEQPGGHRVKGFGGQTEIVMVLEVLMD